MGLHNCRFAIAASLVVGLTWFGLAAGHAQTPAVKAAGKEPTFLFEMRGKPWGRIFEWLTDQTGQQSQPRQLSLLAEAG